MKRSEMQKKLEEFIKKNIEGYYSSLAGDILDLVENAGMLPNTFVFYASDEYVLARDIISELCEGYDGAFEWEPENES